MELDNNSLKNTEATSSAHSNHSQVPSSIGDENDIGLFSIPEISIPIVDLDDLEDESPNTPNDETTTTTLPKVRKRTSVVWQHFEPPVIIKGKKVAQCMHCKQYLSAASGAGTSHLKDHWTIRCPKRHLNLDVGQQTLKFHVGDGSLKSGPILNSKFAQEVARAKLLRMVVIHEYPLSIVDHLGFRDFVLYLNPDFKLISRNTLRSDILKKYVLEKAGLKKYLEGCQSRVSITTDMWTASNQKKGYMAVTCHFIDDEWKLRSRILRYYLF